MNAKIYYFSGTGNSLQVAKDLAAEIKGSKLRAIRPGVYIDPDDEVDCVGFVYPVYAWGAPGLVVEFIKAFLLKETTYVFAVVTCADSPGGTLLEINKILAAKGASLSAGFSIKQPSNYILWGDAEPEDSQQNKIIQSKDRIKQIAILIKHKQRHKPETSGYVVNKLGGLVSKLFRKNIWKQAKKFWVDDKCNQCQTCIRICPTQNIKMENEKLSWGNKCEQCLACLQWCPREAIQYGNKTVKRKRYHHPDILLEEMLPND
ncbi:MAG: 4Fe-4S ferredoxin [Firmicutes bacterium HGW-Firmicutes-12]|nr:MAG: 4Fe-4S ferredoxin [Firmicutes bacterium HGW-Firmicutes-12]